MAALSKGGMAAATAAVVVVAVLLSLVVSHFVPDLDGDGAIGRHEV